MSGRVMTEIARLDEPAGSLQAWAEEMTAAAQIARGVAGTPFVPASLVVKNGVGVDLQATTANVAAALLAGREVGLEPMAALRSVDVINGTPAFRAIALRALAMNAGAQMWVEESSDTRAIVMGRAAGSEQVQRSVWTIDRARTAGLAGKDNWRRMPQAMLIARATSECARLIAPGALLGLPYSAEELSDGPDTIETPADIEAAPAKRTARRRTLPTPAAPIPPTQAGPPAEQHPPTDATPEAPPAGADPPSMITKAQLRALQASFRDAGITDRDDRLTVTRDIIGRGISTANDLYEAEASTVIDELKQRQARAEIDRATTEQAQTAAEEAALEAQLNAAWQADQPDLDWGDDNPDPGGD